jgi:hypothetical protein
MRARARAHTRTYDVSTHAVPVLMFNALYQMLFVGLFCLFNYYTSLPSQAALAVVLNEQLECQKAAAASQDPFSPFVSEFGMRLNHLLVRDFTFSYGKQGILLNYFHSLPYKIAHIMSRTDQIYPSCHA